MDRDYEMFVEKFRRMLIQKTGFEEDRIYFKDREDDPRTDGDRLFLVCRVQEKNKEVCGLYIRELFERYLNGTSMETMAEEVMREVDHLNKAGFMDKALQINDYEEIRQDLFIRLLNVDRNREELKQACYQEIGDIALVLYMRLGEDDGCMTSIKVREDVIEGWGQDRIQVFQDALVNTYFISPPRIYYWERLLFDENYTGENFMDYVSAVELKKGPVGNCLSTTKRINGAVAVFLPGVARRLAELLDGSFYMVFTSIHEVMIHSDRDVKMEDLRSVLRETVKEATPEEDVLTLRIYHYDKDTGRITYR